MGRGNLAGPVSDGAGRHNLGLVEYGDRDSGRFRRRRKPVICLRRDDARNFDPLLDEPFERRGAEIAGSEERCFRCGCSFRTEPCNRPRVISALVRSPSGLGPIGLWKRYKCLTHPQKSARSVKTTSFRGHLSGPACSEQVNRLSICFLARHRRKGTGICRVRACTPYGTPLSPPEQSGRGRRNNRVR
jgi:hypothetical protein